MISGFENVNIPSNLPILQHNIPASVSSVKMISEAKTETNEESERKLSKRNQTGKITASLVGLAVLGFTGYKIAQKGLLNTKETKETVKLFKEYFEELSKIPSYVWGFKDNRLDIIQNPTIKKAIENLENLNAKEKKAFVREYCEMTGFPDLKKISQNIDDEIIKKLNEMSQKADNKVLFAGYDINNSVGRKMALPGSDCDGLFVVLENRADLKANCCILGDSINQRLVETTGKHYPEVWSFDELKNAICEVEKIFDKFLKNSPEKLDNYKSNLTYEGKDFIKAAQFNVDIAEHIQDRFQKDMACRAGFFAEYLRSGKILINGLDNEKADFIKNSALYKYSNITRQEVFRNEIKPKLQNRLKLVSDFEMMSEEKKFVTCKDLLKSSLGVTNESQKDCFKPYDMGNIIDMYKKISSFFD